MNLQNLNILFRNYIDNFEKLNNHEHDEKYKWDAVGHVQKNWNLEIEDLSGMLKEAFSRCYELIDNRFVHPTTGIIKLARLEPEAVREAFRSLLEDDEGDLQKRYSRILTFVDVCNGLLEKHFRGTWKYAQDVRTVIAYLAMIKPDENYIFKSTPAREFARYMEYGDEIGQGSNFKLSSYYHMCDQLIEHMRQCSELMEADSKRYLLTKTKQLWKDSSLHVLAYDMIYCFDAYKLNEGMKEPTIKTRSMDSQQSVYRKEQALRIQAELDELQDRIDELATQIAGLPFYDFTGAVLKTKAFGTVKIERHDVNRLCFEARGQVRTLALPKSIAEGFLIIDDLEIVHRYKIEQDFLHQIKLMEDRQKVKYLELKRYQD